MTQAITRGTRLNQLEGIIERNIKELGERHLAVATAIEEIWKDGLYKEAGYETFKEYVAQRWSYDSTYLYRLIDHKKFIEDHSDIEGIKNLTEHQTRDLRQLADKREQTRLAEKAIKNKWSLSQLAQAVASKLGKTKEEKPVKVEEIVDAEYEEVDSEEGRMSFKCETLAVKKDGWTDYVVEKLGTLFSDTFDKFDGGLKSYDKMEIFLEIRMIK